MESGHFNPSNLQGCPGGQYSPAPYFALWSFLDDCGCSCGIDTRFLRILINCPLYVEYLLCIIAVIVGLILSATLCVVATLAFLPICGPVFLLLKYGPSSLKDVLCNGSDSRMEYLLIGPGISGAVLGIFSVMLVIECIWLPFALMGMITWPMYYCRGPAQEVTEVSFDTMLRYFGRPSILIAEHLETIWSDDD